MAAFSTIALGALTGLTAYQGYKAGKQQAASTAVQGEYEAQLLEQNAGLADLQGADALQRGRVASLQVGMDTRQAIGGQRVGLAAQGIDINDGSAADVQAETEALGAFDALTIRNNAARQAWGFTVEAQDARNRATLTRAGATNLAGAQRAGANNTLLTGATALAGQARTWRR